MPPIRAAMAITMLGNPTTACRRNITAPGRGRGVNVWTCNDQDQMRQLIAAGVTEIITDFPSRLRAVSEAGA